MIALRGGTVVDAEGRREADVAVDDGEIAAVGDASGADETLDVAGKYVAPGLIDAHVHLSSDSRANAQALAREGRSARAYYAAANLEAEVRAGVTTVRDLGAPGTLAIDAREAVADGVLDGPRVLAAGQNITMTGGHAYWLGGAEVDGPAEARKAAREQLKRGADLLKCMATGGVLTEGAQTGAPELQPDELSAIVDVAEAAGVHVAAHAHGAEGIENAARAGVDSIEHGTYMDPETAELLAERGTYWVPTTKALVGILEGGREGGIPEHAVRKTEAAAADHEESFELALDAGVPIAMGSDAGTPFNDHGDAPEEIELMVERGLSPEAALEAGTVNAADLLGLDDVGLVQEGDRADLVVLDADPLEDPTAWQDPELVVAGGRVYEGTGADGGPVDRAR